MDKYSKYVIQKSETVEDERFDEILKTLKRTLHL